ncbi:bifunctional acetate--CoA ligase family protein/GNAT family N-acetyltransferase [Tautonia plasticadhaerens]|uniref:Succinyl-CoA ligase [ADP-forming] subunit alpha n=1 Tax=Tautonia plasticadhaerens TaxID=2527974 RepID=A0A518GX59_9BACT|nr:bifunctional acetate--CoA ligase family protein/GNAT family N-acetyltransferase [Tautonia plasticadhaerens]QDV33152.1 Succinyl-CoA ligase [ADP-forming] subunit alpha [Tautonia plasticadhaerens]
MSTPDDAAITPAHDVLRSTRSDLEPIFSPRTVAVVGATEAAGSVGRTVLWNLLSSPFGGTVYPVNPGRPNVLGVKAYPTVSSLPEPVDLAVIATPAATVPGVVGECVDAGVKGAIVVSAGFKEVGPEGADLERRALEQARRGRMRIVGPNCLGVMNPTTGLNATFAAAMARPGNVAFLSQSGALCTAVLDWSFQDQVGFSAFVSIGSMLDVGWGDLIDYLGDDPRTRAIVIYMESIGDARHFLSAAREVAMSKPIIVIKAGRTAAAAAAAASHTGGLTGSDEVLDAAFRRCGVLRVETIAHIFNMAEVLAKQPRPRGPRLAILTNAGGPGVLATDSLIQFGGSLAELSPETIAELDGFLPDAWSRGNPVDILGDADPDRFARAVEVVSKDRNSDGLLVVLTPQAMTDPTRTADQLKMHAKLGHKPILASWMGGTHVAAGVDILNRSGIPTFTYPDTAARAFAAMWRYSDALRGIYETPAETEHDGERGVDRASAEEIVRAARSSGRTILNEYESKRLLAAYGIPTVETVVATDEKAAAEASGRIGYPVVLKLHSDAIAHKTDVGGVVLNLADAAAVRAAFRSIRESASKAGVPGDFRGVTVQPMVRPPDGYELIVGSSIDPQFGPVLLFGTGGSLVEVFRDRALALPPLNTTLARRMMERTRILSALKGVRGRPPVDLGALERLLVRFSQLVVEQRWIREIDINPLLASHSGLLALDARVIVHGLDARAEDLPRPAIRPYPSQYVEPFTLRDGTRTTIRPIRPEDEPLLIAFHETLSERSVYSRYFQAMKLSTRVAHDRLTRICFIDYDREMALVVSRRPTEPGRHEILAVGRLSRIHGADAAEFALLVADPYQGQGLGVELLRRLLRIARDEGLRLVTAEMLRNNRPMQRVCEALGFRLRYDPDDEVVHAEIEL